MTNQYTYAREKLRQAVYILATGEGDVRSRLRRIYRHLRVLESQNMPVGLKRDLQWVKNEMVKYGPLKDQHGTAMNALDHTMGRIRNSTGKKIAERICSMNTRLTTR